MIEHADVFISKRLVAVRNIGRDRNCDRLFLSRIDHLREPFGLRTRTGVADDDLRPASKDDPGFPVVVEVERLDDAGFADGIACLLDSMKARLAALQKLRKIAALVLVPDDFFYAYSVDLFRFHSHTPIEALFFCDDFSCLRKEYVRQLCLTRYHASCFAMPR